MLTPGDKPALADVIERRNPYSFLAPAAPPAPPAPPVPLANQGMTLPANWQSEIEETTYASGSWQFRGRALRVAKAIRISYTYQDRHGNIVKEYLLIGYEGGAGD